MNFDTKPQISAISRLLCVAGYLFNSHITTRTYIQPSVLAVAVSVILPYMFNVAFPFKKRLRTRKQVGVA
jgi:putative flippase GtrA